MTIQFRSSADLTVGAVQNIRISGHMVPVLITGKRRHWQRIMWEYTATSTETLTPKETSDELDKS